MTTPAPTALAQLTTMLGPATVADLLTVAERDEANRRLIKRGESSGAGPLGSHAVSRSVLSRWDATGAPPHIDKHARRLMEELEWLQAQLPDGVTMHAVLHAAGTRRKPPYEYLRVGSWTGFQMSVENWLKRYRT